MQQASRAAQNRLPVSELLATLIVFVLGAPLAYFFTSAAVDGETRRQEAPLRALLGNPAYDALLEGRPTEQHYLGADRLAPDFRLQERNGDTWTLSQHRGKTVVLNFWSVTCPPCVEEMPSLEQLARILKGRSDIELVAISTDSRWEDVATVIGPDSPLTVLLDPDRAVTRGKYGTRLFPETWVIDPEGVIRLRIDGPRDWASGVALDAIELF